MNDSSLWSPLKISVYRNFWICAFLSNLGTWVQDVAASWVMTHLSTSPLIVSLLSFTSNLPVVFLSIAAGYFADQGHRRRILLFSESMMFIAAALLAYLVWQEKITEGILLLLSLVMGVGFALSNPPFQSVLTDLVPNERQAQAVLVYYIGINITRVLGPTFGGIILGGVGPAAAFFLNSLSFLGLILFFWKWPVKEAAPQHEEKKEIKFTQKEFEFLFSFHNMKLWVEIFIVTFFASSLWALYPTRGRLELGLNSWQYGSLLGFLGLGACFSTVYSSKIMLPERTSLSLAGAYFVYAVGLMFIGIAPSYIYMCQGMFFAGIGWLILATLMNMSSRQLTGKSHLKATMLGVFLAVFYAGMALGSVSWGAFARMSTTTASLVTSAAGLTVIALYKFLSSKKIESQL
ncbi:MFS transporter [Bdellovibrio sp. SKB1291214]|uniref:MFS transporter n=1 Tax=Bdellovibrio sp. SKB1291214 TaxID=1732569 RepID=UPI000B51A844|nr:MFS transporter [Bdellovibrio sp. SKB1291214]UYL07735.1 MFS transporter [Bdellovibrio sp. SKB1291214]